MNLNSGFREKFVKYLSEGIPISIADDEIPLFYRSLSDYINNTDNDYMAFHQPADDFVVVSDRQHDYIRVVYELHSS